MKYHLSRVFPSIENDNIHTINTGGKISEYGAESFTASFNDIIPDPLETDKNTTLLRKYYWFYKNKFRQKRLFKEIEKLRVQFGIQVLIGIFAGGLPLVFYRENNIDGVKIIFSDMDSWFSDVMGDMKRFWYRKYYSFNYIFETADKIDFLSPYIYEGIAKLGINIPPAKASVAPCSFADYTKCVPGNKKNFEIAFASRLEPDKNPVLYLEAAKEIIKEHPELKFHLLGEGSLSGEIRRFISEHRMERNINFMFHPNPPEVFSRTSVFITLQTGTNYPSQSVLEAMACENAVIASNRGDTGLLVNSSNGLIVEPEKDSVTEAIKKLISDRGLTKRLGQQASEFVRSSHTIEKTAGYYISLIKNASGEKNE